jgi:hypothetical protein
MGGAVHYGQLLFILNALISDSLFIGNRGEGEEI